MPPMDKSKEKTALDAITLAFAIELAPDGIKVSAVAPGFTKTNLNGYEGTETSVVTSAPVTCGLKCLVPHRSARMHRPREQAAADQSFPWSPHCLLCN